MRLWKPHPTTYQICLFVILNNKSTLRWISRLNVTSHSISIHGYELIFQGANCNLYSSVEVLVCNGNVISVLPCKRGCIGEGVYLGEGPSGACSAGGDLEAWRFETQKSGEVWEGRKVNEWHITQWLIFIAKWVLHVLCVFIDISWLALPCNSTCQFND